MVRGQSALEILWLRRFGYVPGAPTADGREFASYPYPIPGGGYGIAVRGPGSVLTLERVPGEALDMLGLVEGD